MFKADPLGWAGQNDAVIAGYLASTLYFKLYLRVGSIPAFCGSNRFGQFQSGSGWRVQLMHVMGFVNFNTELVTERCCDTTYHIIQDIDALAHVAIENDWQRRRCILHRSELIVTQATDTANERHALLGDSMQNFGIGLRQREINGNIRAGQHVG